jgi:hypothetical protein
MMQQPVVSADTFPHFPTLIHTAYEHGSLPWPVLAILLIGGFGTIAYAAKKIGNLKGYLNEPPFPTHAATVVAGIVAFLGIMVVAISRAALGMEWPEGYDIIVALVGGTLGVVGLWGVGKRATSAELATAKAMGKANGAPSVTVEGNANITTEMPVPGSTVDPGMRRAVETFEARTREAGAPDDGAVG